MNSNDSFVGAFARSRSNKRSTPSPQQEVTSEPEVENGTPVVTGSPAATRNAADFAGTAAPVAQTADELLLRIDAPQDAAAEMGSGIQNIQAYLQQAVSVSDTLGDSQSVWLEPNEGQMLRVDVAEPTEVPGVESDLPGVDAGLPGVDAGLPGVETGALPELNDETVTPAAVDASPLSEPTPIETNSLEKSSKPTAIASRWNGAAWEVDAFDFPTRVAELFFEDDFFRSIARHMDESIRAGLRSVLVTSLGRGNGRSTVAIGTAVAAAATGLRVALVDADLDSPSLADALRLEMDTDWSAAIRQGQSLESAAVVSLDDNLTLIPLLSGDGESRGAAPLAVTPSEVDQLLADLKHSFDLVMFDGGTIGSWATARIASAVDSSLIVRDTRFTTMNEVALAADQLRRKGIQGIGVIDNFSRK